MRSSLVVAGVVSLVVAIALAAAILTLEDEPLRVPAPGAPAETGFIDSVPGYEATIWAVGDVDRPVGPRIASRIARGRPDRVLYLGDIYENGTAAEFRDFGSYWGPLNSRTAPTPGNHEWGSAADGYNPYWRRVHGEVPPDTYAFTAGGWEILAVNSETSPDAIQRYARWLRARIAQRPGTCRLAFWHRPRFSAGRVHGDDPKVDPLWRALRGGARIVLGGHDHNSQRLRERDGLHQFVVGGGGRGLYPVKQRDPRVAFANDQLHAALRLELEPGAATYALVTVDGSVLDRGELSCRPLAAR